MDRHGKVEGVRRSLLLHNLRDCIRNSRALAVRLSIHPLVGGEARSLLERLESIRGELDAIEAVTSVRRDGAANSKPKGFRPMFR